jgi:hypothetical protein
MGLALVLPDGDRQLGIEIVLGHCLWLVVGIEAVSA